MGKLRLLLRHHLVRRAQAGKWTYLWRSWLEVVLLAYVAACLVQALAPAGPRHDLAGLPVPTLLALVLVIGPLFETVAFQCLPLEFGALLPVRRSIRLALSLVPFALAHRFAGLPTVMAAGVVGGFYFAFTYERWRRESLGAALLMTFLLHSSFNLVGALGLIFFP